MITINEIENYIEKFVDGKRPDYNYLNSYRDSLECNSFDNISNNNFCYDSISNALIFVSDRPNYYFLRLSSEVRKRGIKTIMLTRWGVESIQVDYFDMIVLYDSVLDLKKLNKCKAVTIYVQQWVGWNFLPAYIRLTTNHTVLCNINDFSHSLFDDFNDMKLMGYSKEDINIDLRSEKYILLNIGFITTFYNHSGIKKIFGVNFFKRCKRSIFTVPCLPYKGFFNKERRVIDCNGPFELIYIGGVPADSKNDDAFSDAKMQNVVSSLLESKSNITIFNNPQLAIGNNVRDEYPFFTDLTEKEKRFKFISGFFPWELRKHTKKFNFGLMVPSFKNVKVSKNLYTSQLPTKLFTYIELGLPIIANKDYKAVADFVLKNNVGFVISDKDLNNIDKKIQDNINMYDKYVSNIIRYRDNNNMDYAANVLISNIN